MAKKIVIRGGQRILGTLGSGVGDSVLTQNSTSKELTKIPAIDTSSFLTSALTSGYVLIGSSLDIATPRQITGNLTISNTGVAIITANSIVNSQINSAAGISYSKLNLTNSISNADINSAAGISKTKIAVGTANRILINNASGVFTENSAITGSRVVISDVNGLPTHSTVTSTVLGYLDATSSVQTQLNNKLSFSSAITPANGDLVYYDSGAWINLPKGTTGQYLTSNATTLEWVSAPDGLPAGGSANQYLSKIDGTDFNTQWTTLTLSKITDVTASAAQVNVLATGFYDATSSIQTQLGSKLNNSLSPGAIFFGNASSTPSQLSPATNGQVLTLVAGYPQWQTVTGTGTVTSVDVSGGTTGLSTTGGPVSTTGTITLTGTLAYTNGGTGLTTLGTALQSLRVNAGGTALEYYTPGSSMVYPGAGIALSTGSAWGSSIIDNSTNWNTAYGWGDHASIGYLTTLVNGNGTTINGTGDGVDLGGVTTKAINLLAVEDYNAIDKSIYLKSYESGSSDYASLEVGADGVGTNASTVQLRGVNVTLGIESSFFTTGSGNGVIYTNDGTNSVRFDFNGTGIFTDNSSSKVGIKYAASGYENDNLSLISRGYALSNFWKTTGNTTLTGTASIIGNQYLQLGTTGSKLAALESVTSGYTQFDVYSGANANSLLINNVGFNIGLNIPSSKFRLTYPSGDAAGQLGIFDASGYMDKLSPGTNGQVLTLSAGVPTWAAPSSSLTIGTSTITSGTNTRVLYNNSGVVGEYTVSGSGNVAMTTSPTFTTPNIGTATGTASGNWFNTGTTTLTGAVSVVGTATNKIKFETNGLGISNTDEFLVANTTVATSGNQQSGAITIGAKGHATGSGGSSQDVKFRLRVLPVQGAANPTGILHFDYSINGAAYTSGMNFDQSNSYLSVPNIATTGTIQLNSSRLLLFNGGTGTIAGDANSQVAFRANASTGVPSGGFYRFFNTNGNYSATSGTQLIMGIENNFAPTSGTAIMEGITLSGTINQTGGANGEIRGVTVRPTYTAATTGIGFYYNPSGTPTNNYAFYATSGKIKLDESPNLNATADRILTYNNSSKLVEYRTTESIAGVSYSSVVEGSYTGGNQVTNVYDGSELTDGQIAYVEVVITAVQSSGTAGATGYSMKVKGAFRKSSGTLTQIGSSVLDEPLATWNDTGDSFTGTPGLSVSSGAVVFSQNLTTSKTLAYKFSTRVVKK